MKRIYLFFLIFFLILGCSKKNDLLTFDSSDPLAMKPGVEWLLVSEPYVACYKSFDYNEEVVTHFRKGAIMVVEGSTSVKIGDKKELWYAVKEGWIPGFAVSVYSNKLKAKSASKLLDK